MLCTLKYVEEIIENCFDNNLIEIDIRKVLGSGN